MPQDDKQPPNLSFSLMAAHLLLYSCSLGSRPAEHLNSAGSSSCNGWYKRFTFSRVTFCHTGHSQNFVEITYIARSSMFINVHPPSTVPSLELSDQPSSWYTNMSFISPFRTLMQHISTMQHNFPTILTLSCDTHIQCHQHHPSMAIFRHQCDPWCPIHLPQVL